MIIASVALRAAIRDALAAILGGARIHNAPPRTAAFPYVSLGEARVTETSSEGDLELQSALHAWSRQAGHKEAYMIGARTENSRARNP